MHRLTKEPALPGCGLEEQGITRGSKRTVRVISVTSGKGGVGKTVLVANLACALSAMGRKVMVLDANFGLGNLDVLLGLSPEFTMADVMEGRRRMSEIVLQGPCGIRVLPSSCDVQGITDLTHGEKVELLSQVEDLDDDLDFLLIDNGAGISSNLLFFSMAAQDVLVVVTPEPTSITDACSLIRILSRNSSERQFLLLANAVRAEAEGKEVFRKICESTDPLLNVSIDYLGFVLQDPALKNAVQHQRAVVDAFPEAPSSLCFREAARMIAAREATQASRGNIQFFRKRIFQVA